MTTTRYLWEQYPRHHPPKCPRTLVLRNGREQQRILISVNQGAGARLGVSSFGSSSSQQVDDGNTVVQGQRFLKRGIVTINCMTEYKTCQSVSHHHSISCSKQYGLPQQSPRATTLFTKDSALTRCILLSSVYLKLFKILLALNPPPSHMLSKPPHHPRSRLAHKHTHPRSSTPKSGIGD